eukprot:m.5825 g.5825  ORF g.5825 m.5825 type:complete len:865 (+) comp5095_c0_seq1:513-3107(+)
MSWFRASKKKTRSSPKSSTLVRSVKKTSKQQMTVTLGGFVNKVIDEVVAQMAEDLPRDHFVLCARFIRLVIHNILKYPDQTKYFSSSTTSTRVTSALQQESVKKLLEFASMESNDKGKCWYTLPKVEEPDVINFQRVEGALITNLKKKHELDGWDIFPDDLEYGKQLGAGTFGEVMLGKYKGQPVAIKTLKDKLPAGMTQDFFKEASVLAMISHQNVVSLVGVVQHKNHRRCIVMDLMENTLQDVLRETEFSTKQLLTTAIELAAGLEYIHHRELLHCDIAARNVLVSAAGQTKIADFGLARKAESKECDIRGVNFPISVRWSAPEVWQDRTLSYKTDIWSWGVLFYEMMTGGLVPYVQFKNKKVKEEVLSGYRLPCPDLCPPTFHEIMMDCWHVNPELRPDCTDIIGKLVMLKSSAAIEAQRLARLDTTQHDADGAATVPDESASPEQLGPFSFFMNRVMSEVTLDDSTSDPGKDMPIEGERQRTATLSHSRDKSIPLDRWFHGRRPSKLIKDVSEPLLRHPGDFLVHATRVQGEYIISVLGPQIPHHISIRPGFDKKYTLGTHEYDSISALISDHVTNEIPVDIGRGRTLYLKRLIDRQLSADTPISDTMDVGQEDSSAQKPANIFMHYQVEVDGEVTRALVKQLETCSVNSEDVRCFLDQRDLEQPGPDQPLVTGISAAIDSVPVFIALLSEQGLRIMVEEGATSITAQQLALAVRLHRQNKLIIIPVFIGQYLHIEHPTKPGKMFTVMDDFDDYNTHWMPSTPLSDDFPESIKSVVDYIYTLEADAMEITPSTDPVDVAAAASDISMYLEDAYPDCLLFESDVQVAARQPQALSRSYLQSTKKSRLPNLRRVSGLTDTAA